MMHRAIGVCCALSLLCLTGSAQDTSPAGALFTLGVRQYGEGNFEEAVFTLDAAVRRLAGARERSSDLARAYLYQGAAYLALQAAR